ncbi:hypothetical protein M5585_28020 [Serratia ureilytica]
MQYDEREAVRAQCRHAGEGGNDENAIGDGDPRQAPLATRQPADSEVRAIRKKSGPGESSARKCAAAIIRNGCIQDALVVFYAVCRPQRLPY